MDGDEILEAGVDHVWTYETPVHPSLNIAFIAWFRAHQEQLKSADIILIEHQYTTKGAVAAFLPLLVMEILSALVLYEYPGKLDYVHPSALKKHYEIRGTYSERKAQVVRLAGLQHLAGRVHDIADCVLMADFWGKQKNPLALAQKQTTKQTELRKRLQAKAEPRDQSPKRTNTSRECAKCKVAVSLRWYKHGNAYQCTACYYRDWQRANRNKNPRSYFYLLN